MRRPRRALGEWQKPPPSSAEKRICSSLLHEPPRPFAASHSDSGGPPVAITFLTLPCREEPDVAAVRRPEWKGRALGARQQLTLGAVHVPEPDLPLAVDRAGHRHREVSSVRRDGKLPVARELGRLDLRSDHERLWGGPRENG